MSVSLDTWRYQGWLALIHHLTCSDFSMSQKSGSRSLIILMLNSSNTSFFNPQSVLCYWEAICQHRDITTLEFDHSILGLYTGIVGTLQGRSTRILCDKSQLPWQRLFCLLKIVNQKRSEITVTTIEALHTSGTIMSATQCLAALL